MKLGSASMTILAIVACILLLREAQQFFLPLTLAACLALLLSRPVAFLERRRTPRMAAALLVTGTFTTAIAFGLGQFLTPLEQWITKTPDALSALQDQGAPLQGRLERLSVASERVQAMAKDVVGKDDQPVKVEVEDAGATQQAAGYFLNLLLGFGVTMLLLFFLLARGNLLLKRLILFSRSNTVRRKAIRVTRSVETHFDRFFITITLVNTGLGIVTGTFLTFLGIPDAWLWGVMAGVLNFAPYVGTIISACGITVAAALSQDSLGAILTPGITYVVINGLEAGMLTPALLGERLSVNPLFVFAAIIFLGWMWGIAGMFLAVPLLVILKVIVTELDDDSRAWSRLLSV